MVDSDSSVDAVDLDGKIYRLKCDCCRSKRKENEYDFHPCKVEKCTFSICWACLLRWKDQSDNDLLKLKRFECPQCHTEYDKDLIEQHRSPSVALIQRVNNQAKIIRRQKKKRKKKREQEQKSKKMEMTKHQKLLRMRLEQENRKRNKKKKEDAARRNKTHVLNKNKVSVDFGNNLILKQQWSEKKIHDIFGKIGPVASYEKNDSFLIVTYRKAQSDKARRVLLYLFNLKVSIYAELIKNNQNISNNVNDMFNANLSGGTQQFLIQRDKSTNWNEYSIPKIDVLPPGCKRWIKDPPKRLTKQIFLEELSKRNRVKTQPKIAPNLQNNVRPPPVIKTQPNKPIINNAYPKPSNSASSLLPIPNRQMSAASFSMSDMKPINDVRNGYDKNRHQVRNNYKQAPPGIAPPGIGPPSIAPTVQRSASSYDVYNTKKVNNEGSEPKDNEWNELNGGTHNKRKRDKIDNILRLKHKKKETKVPLIGLNSLKWQTEEKKENAEEQWQQIIVWECDNVRRDVQIVSDDDDLSDFMRHNLNGKNINGFVEEANHIMDDGVYFNGNVNHDDDDDGNEYDYDYSSEEDEIITPPFDPLQPMETVQNIKSIEDMTIKQMLDNLQSFKADQVDAILQKLLENQQENGNHVQQNEEDNDETKNNHNEYDYDYDDGSDNDQVIPNMFEKTSNANNNNTDLQFISASITPPSASEKEQEERAQIIPKNGKIKIKKMNAASLNMERHRKEMKQIAEYYKNFQLSQLPKIYLDRFHKKIKDVYNGKLKELVRYFKDLFSIKFDKKSNQMMICSLVYDDKKRSGNNMKQRTAKKKKQHPVDPTDFRHGPSMMYTIPRVAPKAHAHIIGTTAAVGTANAYSGSSYARGGSNRYTTSSVRSYTSQRKGKRHKAYSDRKVKTYGDYEDDLPHTPSGSEDDDL